MGRLQGLVQGRLRVIATKIAVDRNQRFHREAAGFLTAFVAAHAVRNHGEAALAQELLIVFRLPITKGIFVILAQAPDVGLARHLHSGANLHPGTTSVTGMKRMGEIAFVGTGKLWIISGWSRTLKRKERNCYHQGHKVTRWKRDLLANGRALPGSNYQV